MLQTEKNGNALAKEQKYEEALVSYDKCCDLGLTDAIIYAGKAYCFMKLKKPEEALSSCKEALELDARNFKALIF